MSDCLFYSTNFVCLFVTQLGEPPSSISLACNPNVKPPVSGDCWYNCTFDDISGEDKRRRLRKVLSLLLFLLCGHARTCTDL